MAKTIRTCEGDILDTLCYAYYGTLTGMVEAVYAANPGLAALKQPFASGVVVTLPDVDAPRDESVQLWS